MTNDSQTGGASADGFDETTAQMVDEGGMFDVAPVDESAPAKMAPEDAFDARNAVLAPDPFMPVESDGTVTAGGLVGAVERGATPYAVGAAAGAIAGSVVPGLGTAVGAAGGIATIVLTDFGGAIYNPFAAAFGLPHMPTPTEMSNKLCDWMGIQTPDTPIERVFQSATAAAAGAFTTAMAAKTFSQIIENPQVQATLETLAADPWMQSMSGGLGGAAGQTAAERGMGPMAQLLASVTAGSIPYAGRAAAVGAVAGRTTRQADEAHELGYVLPPRSARGVDESAGRTVSDVMESVSGKVKTDQFASSINQGITNDTAVNAEFGLPAGTPIDEHTFDYVIAKAGEEGYEPVKTLPLTITPDDAYLATIRGLGNRTSDAAKFFPEAVSNAEIEKLADSMASGQSFPVASGIEAVKFLRQKATQSLKAEMVSTENHALGIAQKQAANAIDDLIERHLADAQNGFAETFTNLGRQQKELSGQIAEANNRLTKAEGTIQTTENVYANNSALAARREAQNDVERLTGQHEELETQRQAYQDLMDRASKGEFAQYAQMYRGARVTIAKAYDVKSVTNLASGEVNARGLYKLWAKGKPLSGNLEKIAKAAGAFPKAFQLPSQFGMTEKNSVFDFAGNTLAILATGKFHAAAAYLARPITRRMIFTKGFQEAMFSKDWDRGLLPLPLATGPAAFEAVNQQQQDNQE